MTRVRVLVLILGLVVLALGTVALIAGGLSGERVLEEIERSFVLEPGQQISVLSRNGRLTYEAWDGNEVVVRARKETLLSLFPSLAQWIGRRVEVVIEQDQRGVRAAQGPYMGWLFMGNTAVHFHVQVPRGWEGDIVLRTSNGRIQASDLHGRAELRTSNGPIIAANATGRLIAKTSNGRIELKDVHGVVEAETSNGAIEVEGGTLAQSGRLSTSNGPVLLSARLERGSSYQVRTSNGRVTLALIEPDVEVDLRTSNGRIELATEILTQEVGQNYLSGRVGEGSARLSVRTSNGDISLASVGGSK